VAVDPSSRRTGGSILGDRTRMADLTASEAAFVRPSPSGRHLGGVARATRESMLVLEAAGFDVVIVETVGVGQNEIAVSEMVDTFLLLTLAAPGTSSRASSAASSNSPTSSRSTRPTGMVRARRGSPPASSPARCA
jgi:putative protein kinase ArgK-like GTPase of G3E family